MQTAQLEIIGWTCCRFALSGSPWWRLLTSPGGPWTPGLPLRPGFVTYPIHVPESRVWNLFCALSSLLPGTLPTGLDKSGSLVVHCLDVEQPVFDQMAVEEKNLIRALGELS